MVSNEDLCLEVSTHKKLLPVAIMIIFLALLDSPLLGDLMNHVAAALPTKWKMVGVQLGLSLAKLDEIEASNFGNCKCCFSSVFSEWEKLNTTPYSWSTIIDVLQTPCVEENRVAEDLRSYLVDDYDNM